MEKKKLTKPWKIFGYIILVALAFLIVFDVTVWIVYEVQWDKYVEASAQARESGYSNGYDVCSRQGNIIIDGKEYVYFEAHREVMLDGDYYENLIVATDDVYNDKCPDKNDNLEIFANEIGYINDSNGVSYTVLDIYQIDKCRQKISGDLAWKALFITIFSAPIILIAGLVWLIHFFVLKLKSNNA
ncbi:MAG: hypothetical protein E7259_00115 [Lachnospiraceae bacterium]|nr:hypothetical protein [Lachnospiraceae bacterium]